MNDELGLGVKLVYLFFWTHHLTGPSTDTDLCDSHSEVWLRSLGCEQWFN